MKIQEFFDRMTFGRALIMGFALTAGYYFLFYNDGSSLENLIQSNTAQVQQLNAEISGVQKKIDKARNYQQASQALGASLQKLLSFIPAHFRIGQMMKLISREARIAGLDISRIDEQRISDQDSLEDFNELAVLVDISGQYSQLLTFMSNLTRQRQIFLFEKISMSTEGNDPQGVLKFNLEIHAYSYNGGLENGGKSEQSSVF